MDIENTSISKYYKAIESNEIIACKEIKCVYKHLYHKLTNSDDGFHFEYDRAERAIHFIESFCHLPKVRGNPLVKLMLWQKAMIEAIFGFVDAEGLRQYQEVCLIVGRKNSKSTFSSMIGLYLLLADNEAQPEIYTTATKKDQAKILWQAAVDIIHKSDALRKYCKCRVADIYCNLNSGIFKPLASDSNSLDGLNSSVVFQDEIHAYKDNTLYDVMVDSVSARVQPLVILTTTAGFVREGLYDSKFDEYQRILAGYDDKNGYHDVRRLPIIYKLDNAKEWTDYKCWIKANPGLGEIRSFEKLAADVERVKANPQKLPDLLTKFFDLPQNAVNAFLTLDEARNKETFDLDIINGKTAIGGFDLSQTIDLTSASIFVKLNKDDKKFYVLTQSWMPEDVFEKRMREDKVPYDIWRDKGYLRMCAGNKINYHDVYEWFVEMTNKYNLYMFKIGYDPYSAQYIVDELKNWYGNSVLEEVRQGTKTLSLPLQEMKAEFQKHNFVYNNNPLMTWCLCNLQISIDNNGGFNTIKNRNAKVRDDAAMSLLDAYVSYLRNKQEYDYVI